MIEEQDLEKIRKEMYPNHILIEVFTDSTGSVLVHLSKRVGVGKWLSDTEDWSGVVRDYEPNRTLWVLT